MARQTTRLLNSGELDERARQEIGNPLDYIAEDHMRERTICALMESTSASASINAEDKERLLHFMEVQLPQHLEDEEIDLFPMMLKRCEPEDEIERVIEKLHSDHGHAAIDAPVIVAMLRGDNGQPSVLSKSQRSQMSEFAHHARRHLIVENAIILPIARVRLGKRDLKIMRHRMLERRAAAAMGTRHAE